MKKTVLKLWTENCWKSIFPETYASLVKRTNGKTVEESLVAVESVKTELSNKVDNLNVALNTKLNKIHMRVPSVYGGAGDNFVSVAYTASPTKNTLCYRDGRGAVKTVQPVEDDDAVNRKYLDIIKAELQAQLVGKVDYLGLLNDFDQLATTEATAGDYFINNMTELYINGTWAAIGDVIIAKVDNPTSSDDWDVVPDKFDLDTFIRPLLLWQPSTNVFRISYESNGHIDLPLKGSEGIIVDVAEDNKAIEIHFEDAFLTNVNRAARALVTPISAPAEKSVVAVGTNNAQTMMTLTELKNELGVVAGGGVPFVRLG